VTAHAVSVPGKAFLCGEYAVTEGGQAIVAAVDRRIMAHWNGNGGDGYPLGPEASAALLVAQEAFGPVPRSLALDRRELFCQGTKLGLGSSAAGSVAVAGAAAGYHGHDLSDPRIRHRVCEVALAGHERIAPDGSGADVATATHGGFIAFRRDQAHEVQVDSAKPVDSLVLSLIWTGTAVRTSDLLREVKRFRRSTPAKYDRVMATLHEGAEEFANAFSQGKTGPVIEAARAYHESMKALGAAAGAAIVDAQLEQIARAAAREGGAAKPCGAGGGDVAIAFFDDLTAAKRFEIRCAVAGSKPIDVRWGAEGVRCEPEEMGGRTTRCTWRDPRRRGSDPALLSRSLRPR
jgi:phosphomevalonate kinase